MTLYLHRCQAHRALDLHPIVSHFFRFWLWLTTGMVTKEWAAIHRKHHAKCETAEDPHSPQVYGINRVLFAGVFLYVKESHHPETMQRYGHGTPDDWLERTIYTPYHKFGIVLMASANIALFGVVPGLLMFGIQMAWIPFWAAGVINGIGHFWGYRKFQTRGREHQHRSRRGLDRRRGAAQQPPRLPHLGQVLGAVVRVRPGLALHPGPVGPGPRPRQEAAAQGEARPLEVGDRRADRCRPSRRTATRCWPSTPSR